VSTPSDGSSIRAGGLAGAGGELDGAGDSAAVGSVLVGSVLLGSVLLGSLIVGCVLVGDGVAGAVDG
jgi:hypothetical protein